MMRGTLTLITFISVVFFPWPLTAFLTLVSALSIPLLPLAIGIFFDTLYYVPQTGLLPLFTLSGAILTALALFVRSRLNARIIGR